MAKEDALKWIAEQSAAICNHPYVFPCTWIANCIGESVYKVRKYMKELQTEGYVIKNHEGGYDDYNDRIFCLHGYSLTAKGSDTKYYKDKLEADSKWWNERLFMDEPM